MAGGNPSPKDSKTDLEKDIIWNSTDEKQTMAIVYGTINLNSSKWKQNKTEEHLKEIYKMIRYKEKVKASYHKFFWTLSIVEIPVTGHYGF